MRTRTGVTASDGGAPVAVPASALGLGWTGKPRTSTAG